MRRTRVSLARVLGAAAFSAAMIVCPRPSEAAETTPLEAFGRLPTLENVVISPDGTKIAFVRTRGDSRSLVVAPLAKHEILGGVRVGDTKLRYVEWIDDDNLLSTISSTSPPPIGFIGATREWYQLINFNVSKLKMNPLGFDISGIQTFNVVIGETAVREVSGRSTLFAPGLCVRDTTVPCQFSFSYPERRARLMDEGSEPDTGWLIDESGHIAAKFVYHDEKKLWEIKTHKDSRWTLVASGTAAIDTPNLLGFSADGAALIVRFTENGDPIWKPLNLQDNTWGPPTD